VQRVVAALTLTLAALTGISVVAAPAAQATTFTLSSCSGDHWDAFALWNAIADANDESAHPGPDTIELVPGCDYVMTGPFPGTHYALPPLTSDVTIVGNGAHIKISTVDATEPVGIANVPQGVTLVLRDITLENGVGLSDGSYIRNAGAVQLTRATLDGRTDTMAGPGIVNLPDALLGVTDSVVRGLIHGDATRGGAVENSGSMVVVGSTFEDNNRTAVNQLNPFFTNPAVRNTGYLELVDSAVTLSALSPTEHGFLWGKGIVNTGDLVVRGSSLTGHVAVRGGAIDNSGTLDVQRSSFVANEARNVTSFGGGNGGAIYNTGTATIENSSFLANHANVSGGALYNAFSMAVRFSSLSNGAPSGGDVFNAVSLIPVSLTGSIAASCSGSLSDGGHNLSGSSSGGCPGVLGDPHLVSRSVSGVRGEVLALGPGSDAIDAGGNSCPATDQRGASRPAGGSCDIGAYEDRRPASPSGLHLSAGSNPTRTGHLTLDWDDATDPDGDQVTYDVFAADADDASETQVGSDLSASQLTVDLAEGTHRFRVLASDGNLDATGPGTLTGVVVDKTGPSSPSPTPDRAADFVAPDDTGWWGDHVTVSFSGSTDPVLADTSPGSGVATNGSPQTFTTSGAHTATVHSSDHAGNDSTDASLTVHVDADPPVVGFGGCPATVLLGSTTDLGWTASDAESGLATPSSGSVHVDTATVGERTLTAGATDNVGHHVTATCVLHVIYDFSGFSGPVDNPPASNTVSAGAAVQIAFSLHGDQGLGIIAPGYPVSAQITCGTNPTLTTGQATSAVKPGLGYSPGGTGRYVYPWKTSNAWSGTCRQLVLKLDDGTYHRANFRFR
jgi:hypothetical protein